MPANRGLGFPQAHGEPALPRRDAGERPGYYDVPMLKPPVWHDLISWYFFLGGLSGGAYVTARLAERFGGEKFRKVATVGTGVAAAAVLPCAPLLIADLGDPKRFHHMLRVFKPESPMNLGAWTLTAYHGAGAAALAREWLRRGTTEERRENQGFLRNAADGLLVAVADVAGVPLALLLASYTGVLLTGTSNPAWVKSPWLPALFSASAISSGSAAVSLALEGLTAAGVEVGADVAREPLHTLHTVAHLAEVATLVGYLSSPAGRHAPRASWTLAAIAGSELLKRLPVRGSRFRRWFDIGSAALGLLGAYHLRSSLVKAGHASANDPRSRH
jgi:formate-dependent nitrite reductase membrane component NrfD